ncbi:MAG: hypothetical protein H0U87_09225 [Acidobacteria bacterium]|jgi:hypothetical protein|nr:hypothetical protein [Acidobacteriota bacterium]
MLVSLFLLFLLTVSGFALTYLFAADKSFLWCACAGNVAGSVAFSLICFLAACSLGFTPLTISLSYLLTVLPLTLFARKSFRQKFSRDWRAALKTLEGADFRKLARLAYYIFFLVLFWFFFQRAMMETPSGAIFIGSSHNLGDLPFHLGAIFSFTDGQNFPPENPSFAFAKFTYPFMVDLIAATFVKFGVRASDAFLVQNVFLAFSLLVILERFVFKLTENRLAARLAAPLLFFCGGFGFVWFFRDVTQSSEGFYQYLWHLPLDYTIRESKFRFGNSLTTLFLTQRSLLLGMPLTLIALEKVREIFNQGNTKDKRQNAEVERANTETQNSFSVFHSFPFSVFLVGLLAGTLPLVHTHSLAVLFVVCACLFFFSIEKWRLWLAFGAGVAVIAIPELLWAMSGSATRFGLFFGQNFGWDARGENIFVFYARNLGLFIPLLLAGIYFYFTQKNQGTEPDKNENKLSAKTDKIALKDDVSIEKDYHFSFADRRLLLFYIPFLLCFIVSNALRLAPWEWDNIKILIYWFVGSLPFVALLLARFWQSKNVFYKSFAVACFVCLTFSGALDVWRVCSRAINYQVFETDSVRLAEQIKQRVEPRAMFLNAPTYNSAVVLSGRRSFMRYIGHLSSYAIDYAPRENELKRIYEGSALAADLLKKYDIQYVVVSPEERNYCQAAGVELNEDYFRNFPVVAQVGQYRVYKIK